MGEPSGDLERPINSAETAKANAMQFLNEQKESGYLRHQNVESVLGYLFSLGSNRDIIRVLKSDSFTRSVPLTDNFSVTLQESKKSYPNRFFPDHLVEFRDRGDSRPITFRYTEHGADDVLRVRLADRYRYAPHTAEKAPRGDLDVFYENFIGGVREAFVNKYGPKKGKNRSNKAFDQLAKLTHKDIVRKFEQAVKARK